MSPKIFCIRNLIVDQVLSFVGQYTTRQDYSVGPSKSIMSKIFNLEIKKKFNKKK